MIFIATVSIPSAISSISGLIFRDFLSKSPDSTTYIVVLFDRTLCIDDLRLIMVSIFGTWSEK